MTEIKHLLDVDVLVLWSHEDVMLSIEIDVELVLVALFDRSDGLQQTQDAMPLNIVTGGVLEDLDERVAVMIVEVFDFGHDRSLLYFRT